MTTEPPGHRHRHHDYHVESADDREDAVRRMNELAPAVKGLGMAGRYGVRIKAVKIHLRHGFIWQWGVYLRDEQPEKPPPPQLAPLLQKLGRRKSA